MLVVKIGGSAGANLAACCSDIAALWAGGLPIVLLHGASDETNRLADQLGYPPRFVTSLSGMPSRYTDRRTLEIFMMAVMGTLNTGIVERLQQLSTPALGLSGLSGRILEGPRKDAIKVIEDGRRKVLHGDFTGRVERVNSDLLRTLLTAGYLPVLAPLASSEQGEAMNVDGDRAAAAVAVALGADTLVILSNVPGLLSAPPDETTLIRHIPAHQIDHYDAVAQGRMKKKMLGATEALRGGVARVIIADARQDAPVSRALRAEGTVIGRLPGDGE